MNSDFPHLALALIGYGKMGRAIETVALARGHHVVARVDPTLDADTAISSLDEAGADVALEFTTPDAAPTAVRAALSAGVSVVSGTTAWGDRLDEARAAAEHAGVGFLWAPNFSIGMQLTFRLVEAAGAWLGATGLFAPYLVEEHHDAKKDAPSGTARRLADTLVETTPGKTAWGAAPSSEPPPSDLVPVAWVRAGAIPGTHRVGWDGRGETIEVVHRVRDRSVFATGAVVAAEWLAGRSGPCSIDDMLNDIVPGLGDHPRSGT
jgi:4-hydroxy-tetrahydrodipicolinate reductase